MSYKRIKKFHITTNELPKTRLGKIKRHFLESLITEKQNTKPDAKDLENRSQTYLSLKEIIDNETNSYAKENDHLEIDLALDSLGRIAVIAFIEERFGVEIKENQLDELSTLKKLETYIDNSVKNEAITMNHRSWKEILELSDKSLKIPKPGVIHWLMSSIISVMMIVRYRIKGKYNTDTIEKPTIFVGNHLSALDGLFITSKLSWKIVRKTLFFAKEKHFNSAPKRFFANHHNIILMDINSNVKSSMQQMYDALKNGRNIVIFPEGTRTSDGELNEFKDGFAILALALKIQIVPVAISGIGQFEVNKSKFLGLFQKIKVDFLSTITPKENETIKELNSRVYNAIKTALTKK